MFSVEIESPGGDERGRCSIPMSARALDTGGSMLDSELQTFSGDCLGVVDKWEIFARCDAVVARAWGYDFGFLQCWLSRGSPAFLQRRLGSAFRCLNRLDPRSFYD